MTDPSSLVASIVEAPSKPRSMPGGGTTKSSFWQKILGELCGQQAPVLSIPRPFLALCQGDHLAALFLSQCLYWTEHKPQTNGWFSKSFKDWETELGMSTFQVRRAVKTLKAFGLEVKKHRSACYGGAPTMHYRIDKTILATSIKQFDGGLASFFLMEEHSHSDQEVSRKTYTEITQRQKANDSRAESDLSAQTPVMSPNGDAHAGDASHKGGSTLQNHKSEPVDTAVVVKAQDIVLESTPSLNTGNSLPVSGEGDALLRVPTLPHPLPREDAVVTKSPKVRGASHKGQAEQDVREQNASHSDTKSTISSPKMGNVGTRVCASVPPIDSAQSAQSITHSHKQYHSPTPPHVDVSVKPPSTANGKSSPPVISPMQAAIMHAFKLPRGAYAGKIGQFFAGKIPRRGKDLWTQHQPETPATPQEILALLLWYKQHPAYAKSFVEHGGKLPSTPAILRDRLDEFRDSPDHAKAVEAARPLLETLLKGETPPPISALPLMTSYNRGQTGLIESASAYSPYTAQHDPAYHRPADRSAVDAFGELFQ